MATMEADDSYERNGWGCREEMLRARRNSIIVISLRRKRYMNFKKIARGQGRKWHPKSVENREGYSGYLTFQGQQPNHRTRLLIVFEREAAWPCRQTSNKNKSAFILSISVISGKALFFLSPVSR